MAKEYYHESPFIYTGNNPILYIDPDGQKKIKLEGSFKMTTGKLAIKIAKGLGYTLSGGNENSIRINISFDTDSKRLGIGGSLNYTEDKGWDATAGLVGGGEHKIKEKSFGGSVGFDFKDKKFFSADESYDDPTAKREDTVGVLGVASKTTTQGGGSTLEIGLDVEGGVGIVGAGVGVSLKLEDNQNSNNQSTEIDSSAKRNQKEDLIEK